MFKLLARLIAIGANNIAVALLLRKLVTTATVIKNNDKTITASRFTKIFWRESAINKAPPVSCKAVESIIDDATNRKILLSSAFKASLIVKTFVKSINITPRSAATVIFKSPVAAAKIVKIKINLERSMYCFAGRYIADHSIGIISFLPLRFLISSSSPFINNMCPSFWFFGKFLTNFFSFLIPIILQLVSASKLVCVRFLPIKKDLGVIDASINIPLSEEKFELSMELNILSLDLIFSVSWFFVISRTNLSPDLISISSKGGNSLSPSLKTTFTAISLISDKMPDTNFLPIKGFSLSILISTRYILPLSKSVLLS